MQDRQYILGLCDEVIAKPSLRGHRLHFLRGADGHRIAVDAFYPALRLIVQFREADEPALAQDELRRYGVRVMELRMEEFGHTAGSHLRRSRDLDIAVVRARLAKALRRPGKWT
jgi:hypothetical protein